SISITGSSWARRVCRPRRRTAGAARLGKLELPNENEADPPGADYHDVVPKLCASDSSILVMYARGPALWGLPRPPGGSTEDGWQTRPHKSSHGRWQRRGRLR